MSQNKKYEAIFIMCTHNVLKENSCILFFRQRISQKLVRQIYMFPMFFHLLFVRAQRISVIPQALTQCLHKCEAR